jgi:hypothetical protein
MEVRMTIICGKCKQEMQEVELEQYEFEGGIVLENVKAMRCTGGHITFTEAQAQDMEQRTEDIKNMLSGSLDRLARAPGPL